MLRAGSKAVERSAPEPASATVFVSYAREELLFVRELEAGLASSELKLWFDVDGLLGGERFWDEISKAIDAAVAVVFVITPESVASVYCRRELEFAAERQKRIVPVLRREIAAGSTPSQIAGIQWVFLREVDPQNGLESLKTAVRADWVWLRQHSRILARSSEWALRERETSLLLRGHDLREAENWLQERPGGRERPISLHYEFIAASRRATNGRRVALSALLLVAVTTISVSTFFAADYYVANLNSLASQKLDTESADGVVRARSEAARAEAVCRYMPRRTIECAAAEITLGIAERASTNLEVSSMVLSRLINRFEDSPPGSDAEWALLAAARWERAVTTIFFAEAARSEIERSNRYAKASTDMSEAQRLFDRLPEQAKQRPLAITRARLMLVAGSYQAALDELEQMESFSAEQSLLLSIAYLCVGRPNDASAMLGKYVKALPGGTDSPQFKRELAFLERNSTCTPITH